MASERIILKKNLLMQTYFKKYLNSKKLLWIYDFTLNPPELTDAMAIFRGQQRVAFPIPKKYTAAIEKVAGAPNPKLFPKLLKKMIDEYDAVFETELQAFFKTRFYSEYDADMQSQFMSKVNFDKIHASLNATPAEIKILKGSGKAILKEIFNWLRIGSPSRARKETEKLVKLCAKKKNASITDAKVAFNRIDDELKKQGAFVGLA